MENELRLLLFILVFFGGIQIQTRFRIDMSSLRMDFEKEGISIRID